MRVCYVCSNRGGSPLVSQAVGAWYRGSFSSLWNDVENRVDLFSLFLIVGGTTIGNLAPI